MRIPMTAASSCRLCPFDCGVTACFTEQARRIGHERHWLEAGRVLFRPGERSRGVYVLTRGLVAVRRVTSAGESMIVRLVFPVRTFGLEAAFDSGLHASEALALTDSHVCVIETSRVQNLLALDPELGKALMRRLAADLGAAEEGVLTIGQVPVRQRCLRLLQRLAEHALAERLAVARGSGVQFDLPMTHRDLALVLGIRAETLSRMLRLVASENLAIVHGHRVEIGDLEALATETESACDEPCARRV